MGQRRNWTREEEELLQELWGHRSIEAIARRLGRSVNAIKIRVSRMGLPPWVDSGDFVSLNQLTLIMTGRPVHTYQAGVWIRRGLPVHNFRRSQKSTVRGVYIEDFWKWAEKNRSFLDFSRLEPLTLGEEPPWVAEQRRKDAVGHRHREQKYWTRVEDERLRHLASMQRYNYAELAEMLGRSENAVRCRCRRHGIKTKPERESSWEAWTAEQTTTLADGIRNGESYIQISLRMGKTEWAVKGMVGRTYLTQDRDKVRKMLGSGAWGENRPVPTVRRAMSLTEYRRKTKKQITRLAQLLQYRMEQMG